MNCAYRKSSAFLAIFGIFLIGVVARASGGEIDLSDGVAFEESGDAANQSRQETEDVSRDVWVDFDFSAKHEPAQVASRHNEDDPVSRRLGSDCWRLPEVDDFDDAWILAIWAQPDYHVALATSGNGSDPEPVEDDEEPGETPVDDVFSHFFEAVSIETWESGDDFDTPWSGQEYTEEEEGEDVDSFEEPSPEYDPAMSQSFDHFKNGVEMFHVYLDEGDLTTRATNDPDEITASPLWGALVSAAIRTLRGARDAIDGLTQTSGPRQL